MDARVVGVIGAGVMGSGVAQDLAQSGHRVILLDTSEEILARARQEITNNVRLRGLFQKEKQKDSTQQVLARVTFSTDYSGMEEADFVVENVTEKWSIKKAVSYTHLTLPTKRIV